MPPTITLRDYPPDISKWAAASTLTSSIQTGNSTLGISAVGFIVPLVIITAVLAILFGACW
jgi:hypothetical protein